MRDPKNRNHDKCSAAGNGFYFGNMATVLAKMPESLVERERDVIKRPPSNDLLNLLDI